MPDDHDEILIVRHGHSSHVFPDRLIKAAEFRAWIDEYNRAGIDLASDPPRELLELAHSITCVVCSDLPRAAASAQRLCPGREMHVSSRFREAGRPLTGDWFARLPLSVWDRISVILWRLGCIMSDESQSAARLRARKAADELIHFAKQSGRILYIGHGLFNSMVAVELRRLGWQGPARMSDEHWGLSTYRFPRTTRTGG
jgi:broad specificity phosphatase PhoE